MKAIEIYVYRSLLGDCTNGGVSSRYDKLLLACEDGYINITGKELNLVKVTETMGHKKLEPVNDRLVGAGWMNGGNCAYSSDRRFPSEYPLMIHDRQESWDMYNSMD